MIGLGRSPKCESPTTPRGALKRAKPDVVVLCTSSALKKVMPQIETVLKARCRSSAPPRSSSYPVGQNRALAKKIDALAKKAKVAVLGTGVNPGFAMDALPIALDRRVRAGRQRPRRSRPGRPHAPAAVPAEDRFGPHDASSSRRRSRTRACATSGWPSRSRMIADAFGWKLDKVTDEIKPKIADATVESEFLAVDPGYVCGIVQDGIGWKGGKPLITLHMEAYLGAPESLRRGDDRGHRRASSRRSAAASTATSRRRRSPSTRSRRSSPRRRACGRCATWRCRRGLEAGKSPCAAGPPSRRSAAPSGGNWGRSPAGSAAPREIGQPHSREGGDVATGFRLRPPQRSARHGRSTHSGESWSRYAAASPRRIGLRRSRCPCCVSRCPTRGAAPRSGRGARLGAQVRSMRPR